MNKKRLMSLALATLGVVSLAGCGKEEKAAAEFHVSIARSDDDALYKTHFGEFDTIAKAAKAITNDSERFVKYAEAEANLLGKAVMMPYSTEGGNYAVTRVAPRSIPYAKWGNDDDRLKNMVFAVGDKTSFIKSTERAEMIQLWQAAREGGEAYDPAAYLTGKGYTLGTEYKTTFQTGPVTLDILNTSEQSDTEVLINCFDGLVEYDNLGFQQMALATAVETSQDGKTVKFTIRDDAKWVKSDGTVYADVTADDFVAGFQHMLDAGAGLDFLVDGVVVGVSEYLKNKVAADFANVGCKAEGNKVVFTLVQPESYFVTRLTYSCFMPMNRQFFLSKGGAFGIKEYATASEDDDYGYGLANKSDSMVYCGAFIPDGDFTENSIKLKKNPHYYSTCRNTKLEWVLDNGENPNQYYADTLTGTYSGMSLLESTGLLQKAKKETIGSTNLFDGYHYITDTTTTSYLLGVNVNRGTYELSNGSCKSAKTSNEQAIQTHMALQNVHFRRAIFRAWDRVKYNAVSRGEETAANNLRNCYTDPGFLVLSEAVTYAGHTFSKGTSYGDLIQYFGDQAGLGVNFADGQDGWYNEAKAKEEIALAKKEMAQVFSIGDGKIHLDICYYAANTTQVKNANAFKQIIEKTLGDEIVIDLVAAQNKDDFYASGYRAKDGVSGNFDLFYGSGWGPDYGDPSSYLDTFTDGGYMNKICGLQ